MFDLNTESNLEQGRCRRDALRDNLQSDANILCRLQDLFHIWATLAAVLTFRIRCGAGICHSCQASKGLAPIAALQQKSPLHTALRDATVGAIPVNRKI
ncbi:hypothetical protein [Thalassobius sp. MITS945101]|uniref:hypothetical protein n=1 Tax=Thalassobius sp. MITS945101 TaxID=3096994 RepID=UPI00399AE68B